MSQLLAEKGMGGKRNETEGQRAQELPRSPSQEPGPRNVKKTEMADELRGVWTVPHGPEHLVLVGRPHLKMESEPAPFLFHVRAGQGKALWERTSLLSPRASQAFPSHY